MPANVAAVVDVPCEIFGGLVSDLAPTDLPMGASPDCQDVAFQIGLVKTRPGLQNAGFATIGGNPTVNYLKTYITQQQVLRMLVLDSLGNVYKENPIGTLQSIGTVTPGEYAKSSSQFAREYMAFGDGKFGLDIPRQYDDTNFDRVSQVGPGVAPSASDENVSYSTLASPNGLLFFALLNIAASPTGLTQTGTLVTVTLTGLGGISPYMKGLQVKIAGAGVAGYNGTWTVTSVDPLGGSFQFVSNTVGLANSGGGTVDLGIFTVAFTASESLLVGQSITVSGAGVAAYNGTWTVLSILNSTTVVAGSSNFGLVAASGGATVVVNGNIAAGKHGISVCFKTRQGYITAPAPVGSWTASGGKRVIVTNIPLGPPNVVARILIFTLSGGQSYYYLTGVSQIFSSNFVINDNTTMMVTVDFSDAVLAVGTSADYLFRLVELGECQGTIDYALRQFWWGERAKVQNFNNLTFDGGNASGTIPQGWTVDPTNGSRGAQTINAVWGNAYGITGDGATAILGRISQTAYQDVNGVPILLPNTAYSVRVRLKQIGNAATQGTFNIEVFSSSLGSLGLFTVNATAVPSSSFGEFIGPLMAAQTSIPSDAVLRLDIRGTVNFGCTILADNVEPYQTNQPYNTSLLRGSRVEDPESFDGVNGVMQFGENDGTRITTCFKLRKKLYVVKERSLWSTEDDGINEPTKWNVGDPVSSIIGTPSVNGVGVGSDWVVIAGRLGLYYFDGGEPEKISQEIQKPVLTEKGTFLAGWDNINWQYGHTIWCQVDEKNRRILVGAPVFGATSPNIVFVLDYRGLDTGTDITNHKSIHISAYTGKIYDIADSRKWTRWNMTINSAGQIERTDGTFHLFMGNGAGTGKIYDLLDVENFTTPSQFGDDGVAINSYYDTYYFLRPQEEEQYQLGSHRKLYRYVTLYIEGQGVPSLFAFPPGNHPSIAIPQSGAALPTMTTALFPVNITSISRTLGTVTVITATPHNVTTSVVIQGTGNAAFDNQAFGNITVINPTEFVFPQPGPDIPVIAAGTVEPLIRDVEIPTDIHTERCKYRVQTNALGSWFSLRTLTPSIMTDPFAPIRGVN